MNVVPLKPAIAEKEARAWVALLSQLRVTTEDLVRFREWRRDPTHQAAYERVDARTR